MERTINDSRFLKMLSDNVDYDEISSYLTRTLHVGVLYIELYDNKYYTEHESEMKRIYTIVYTNFAKLRYKSKDYINNVKKIINHLHLDKNKPLIFHDRLKEYVTPLLFQCLEGFPIDMVNSLKSQIMYENRLHQSNNKKILEQELHFAVSDISPISIAVNTNNLELLKLLLPEGISIKGTKLLHIAVENQNLEMVKELLKAGADVNYFTEPKFKVYRDSYRDEKYMYRYTPLLLSIITEYETKTDELYRRDRDNYDSSKIVFDSEITKELIKKGADINFADEYGMTAFYYALMEYYRQSLESNLVLYNNLVSYGVDINKCVFKQGSYSEKFMEETGFYRLYGYKGPVILYKLIENSNYNHSYKLALKLLKNVKKVPLINEVYDDDGTFFCMMIQNNNFPKNGEFFDELIRVGYKFTEEDLDFIFEFFEDNLDEGIKPLSDLIKKMIISGFKIKFDQLKEAYETLLGMSDDEESSSSSSSRSSGSSGSRNKAAIFKKAIMEAINIRYTKKQQKNDQKLKDIILLLEANPDFKINEGEIFNVGLDERKSHIVKDALMENLKAKVKSRNVKISGRKKRVVDKANKMFENKTVSSVSTSKSDSSLMFEKIAPKTDKQREELRTKMP